ncbi:hypothetical protein [Dietzia sp. 179-F 9C3 NHS]|uniref:hypothetical protein n=1 Tax=Dietzia sp. 179-F 9C3 NHS TaxID=3374295 RepID=UPI003879212A
MDFFLSHETSTWILWGAFLLVTVATLVSRAFQTHAWYRERFGDECAPERRALVPGLL